MPCIRRAPKCEELERNQEERRGTRVFESIFDDVEAVSSAVQRLDTLAAQLEKDVATLSRANSYEDDDDDEGTTPADSKFGGKLGL